jgi:hypothetical protein
MRESMGQRIILILVMFSLTSCGYLFLKEIKCRELRSDNLRLFPGKLNDTISFIGNDSIIKHFIINDKRVQHTTKYISDTGCSCHDIIQMLYTSGQDSIWTMYQLNYIYDQKEKEYFEIFFVLDGIKNGFTEVYQDSAFTGHYVNGNNYPGQRKYKWLGESEKNIIKQCLMADNIGLLQFQNIKGDTWTRTNIRDQSTDIKTFDFKERTCD